HKLLGELLDVVSGELTARQELALCRILVPRIRATDTETFVGIGRRHQYGFALPGRWIRGGPAGAASLYSVRVIHWPAATEEVIQPAFAAVWRGLVRDPGQTAPVPKQQGQAALLILRDKVLHIHLFDLVCAIRID